MNISSDEREFILKLARSSITSIFNDIQIPDPPPDFLSLNEKAGAFVTLSIEGSLRGCIGYIITEDNLYNTIINASKQAALNDPRFPSLTEGELDLISIEVSVLSPPFKMNSYGEIEIGKHGLILTDGLHRGLLLPQVPVEHNLSKDEFLSALCQKAGVPSEKWRNELLNIEMFTATVFSEKELEKHNE
jgi:AmmeMemoRadiSam system protein A